jgi:Fe2+ or Zn2+ uptake regulation protein
VPDEIEAYIPSGWVGRAETELRRAGYHSTLPRSTITEAIGSKHCAITADELFEELSERFGQRVEEHELILRGTCSACASN